MSFSEVKVFEYISEWKTFQLNDFRLWSDTFYVGEEKETSWKLLLSAERKMNSRGEGVYKVEGSFKLTSGYPLTATGHIKVKMGEKMVESSTSSLPLIKKYDYIKFKNLPQCEFPCACSAFVQYELQILKTGSTTLLYRKIESMNNVVADILTLLEDDNSKDISLISKEGKVIRAHKIILIARSEVFAAMFRCDMQENMTNRVEINDLEEELLNEMLRFIYSGDLSTWNYDLAKNMFLIGDRYKISSLKHMCSTYLKRNLNIETVVELLILSDMHADGVLKKACKLFIEDNANDVLETTGWSILQKNHEHLLNEVHLSMAGNKKPKIK